MYIFGGYNGNQDIHLSDVYKFETGEIPQLCDTSSLFMIIR